MFECHMKQMVFLGFEVFILFTGFGMLVGTPHLFTLPQLSLFLGAMELIKPIITFILFFICSFFFPSHSLLY